jgi:hypothetical protein
VKNESKNSVISVLTIALATALMAPYFGCHVVTSPPQAERNRETKLDNTDLSTSHTGATRARLSDYNNRDELEEIQNMLAE